MELQHHKIKVQRSARYCTLGNTDAEEIWFMFHGYGQLSADFANSFADIDLSKRFLVFPEGLSRFYWKGFNGPVVASWMTREDRESEIEDQQYYLNQILHNLDLSGKKLNALGFSQGAATASRWVYHSDVPVSNIILWAGEPAWDIDYRKEGNPFTKSNVTLVCGTKDPFISEDLLKKLTDNFRKNGPPFSLVRFEGAHEIEAETLNKILNP